MGDINEDVKKEPMEEDDEEDSDNYLENNKDDSEMIEFIENDDFQDDGEDDFKIELPNGIPTSWEAMTSIRMFYDSDQVHINNSYWELFLTTTLDGKTQETRHICQRFTRSKAPLKWLFINEGAIGVAEIDDFPDTFHPVKILRAGGYYEHDVAIELYLREDNEEKVLETSINWPDLVLDLEIVEKTIFSSWKKRFEPAKTFVFDVAEFELAERYLETPVCDLIEEGRYFELQLEESPIHVVYAKVIKNYDGWLLVEFGKNFRWVHVFNPHCHQLGWGGKQLKADQILDSPLKYISREGLLEKCRKRPVNPFVFRTNGFDPHGFDLDKTNVLVVYLDVQQRNFYMAHVVKSKELTNHFFHLAIGDYVVQYNPEAPMFFHINHPRIFGYKTVKELGVKIHLPPSVVLKNGQTDVAAYMAKFMTVPRLVKHYHLLDKTHSKEERAEIARFHNIHVRKTIEVRDRNLGAEITHMSQLCQMTKDDIYTKMDSLKFVEVFRMSDLGVYSLTAAEVIQTTKSMLVLKVDGEEDSPVYTHMNDPNVFPCGSGTNMKLAVTFWASRADNDLPLCLDL